MGKDDQWQNFKALGVAFQLGTTMGAAVLVGYFSGKWIDSWLGTKPIFMIIMLVLSLAAGFKIMYDEMMKKDGGPEE